ncbi:AMP-binding protein [Frigidibacter sp. ROC022]|uniref:AMP-binding protein n=1 Tax=Frigidibacter sp. ROC022 TaxID=2971796 RepID=UPI00215A1E9B|nr:AMP-binding protein [Frigidibacter sp. ROC022]MCR8724078.1 AMP-binding protein [Frigidibacter sp. ROC022]
MNPAEWLRRTSRRHPQRPALLEGETVVADYAGFDHAASAIAAGLARFHGIAPGDRVAIFAANCTDYLPVLYGAWSAGAAVVPINAKLHPKEVAWMLDHSGARLCFTSPDHVDDLAGRVGGDVAVLGLGGEAHRKLLAATPRPEPAPLAADDLLWLFYTSGTTGKPKGVMLTAANLMAMTLSYFVDVDDVGAGDAALYAAPMSHGAGLYNFMHVIRGARHVVPRSGGFDPDEILDLSARLRNVSMFAAPTMVGRLIDTCRARGSGAEGIRTIVYGGGPMYLADIIAAVETIGPRFVQIYGQGECPMAITALSREDIADRTSPRWRERLASVGRAQSAARVRIADSEGNALPPGEIGEILVQGVGVMAGYWRNEQATAATLRDGWLWTGDVGAMDEDGYVTLHDRSKDMIISGGSNIYPREVEEVLLTHPELREVAVVGRRHADWGEEVVAFVVRVPGGTVGEAELDALCLDQIARFKRPKAYVFCDELPKNNYGKVLKTELRNRLEEVG